MDDVASILGRVLIVDDSPSFRRAAGLLLTAQGCDVVGEAGSAAEGLLLTSALRPDLVLLDVSLPDGSGIELCAKLTDLTGPPQIIVISSRDGAGFQAAALASGAIGFLAKSRFSAGRLATMITAPTGA